MPSEVSIRAEEPRDREEVRRVNTLAFGQPDEADIVSRLAAANAVILSLVAEVSGQVVGHILFSPVTIESPAGAWRAVGLAPMAVAPDHQRAGIGGRLVRRGLDELRARGHDAVVVLGHPVYYPRFGFVRASRFGLRCEFDCPDDAFMALELRPGALGERGGVVRYRPELTGA